LRVELQGIGDGIEQSDTSGIAESVPTRVTTQGMNEAREALLRAIFEQIDTGER